MEGDLLGLGADQTPAATPPPAQSTTQPAADPAPAGEAKQPEQQQPPAAAPAESTSDASKTTETPAATENSTPETTASTTGSTTASEPAQGTTWKPVATDQEPTNPTLKEIKEKFAGRWTLARSDPYDEYLKAVGIGFFNRQLASKGTPEQVIAVSGDTIFISFHSTFHNQNYTFKLDESVENLVEKIKQSVFCSYKEGKLILQLTPVEGGFGKTQEVERYINENSELVVIYTSGGAVCRRYFSKLPDVREPPNVVG